MSVLLKISPDDPRLRPNPWNTNVVPPENERRLDASLNRLGTFKPIIVRELGPNLEILGGQHRWESAKRLGLPEIPAFNLGPIDDRTAKEISLADNARYGVDDSIALADLLRDLGDTDQIVDFLPFNDADLTDILSSSDIALEDLELDEVPTAEPTKPEESQVRPVKTHTILRFKVQNADAERIAKMVAATQRSEGYTAGDDLTNAGDALVHLLLSRAS